MPLLYKFKEVCIKEADTFAKENGIFFQTSNWSDFRSCFKTASFLGYNGDKVVLSCVLFLLPVYLTPYKIGYITRGFVCDYSDKTLISEFTDFLKDYMKRKHIIYLIFDPHCQRRVDFNDPENDINEFFKSLGYIENNILCLQPKTNYLLKLNKDEQCSTEEKRLWKGFSQRLQNDIQISYDRGVSLEKYRGDNKKAVEIFYNLLVETTAKKGFGHRDLEYYQKFASSLADYVTIYLYKYNSERDILYTENILKDVEEQINRFNEEIANPETTDKKRERLYPKLKEAEKQKKATIKRLEIAKNHTDDPYISAFFYIKMGNKAYNFYGANSVFLRDLKLTANYWDLIKDSLDGKVETFNMGGTLKLTTDDIKKDPMYELYQYKCQYGGEFVEMPGEFFLISRPKLFDLFHNKLHYFRRLIFRL